MGEQGSCSCPGLLAGGKMKIERLLFWLLVIEAINLRLHCFDDASNPLLGF